MNLLQKKLFKISSQAVTDYFSGSYSNEHVEESIDIITGTKDMPFEQMLDASIFSWFQNTFHINGISTLLSRLVRKYSNVSYSEFYADLFEHMQGHEWLKNEQDQVRQYYYNWMTTGRINHPSIGIEIHGWNLIHRTVLNIHMERQYNSVFDMLEQFMAKYNLPADLLADAMQFQRRYFVAYDAMNTYPENLTLNYNIWEYLSFDHDLIQAPATYRLEFPEDKTMSFERFLELFYFARRRNFGKATVERVGDDGALVDVARRGSAAARGKTTKELATVVV